MSKWREWLVGTALGRVVAAALLALLGMVAGELTPLPEALVGGHVDQHEGE